MSVDIAKSIHDFSYVSVTNSLTIRYIFSKEEYWFTNFQEQGKSWKKGQPYLFGYPPPPKKKSKRGHNFFFFTFIFVFFKKKVSCFCIILGL